VEGLICQNHGDSEFGDASNFPHHMLEKVTITSVMFTWFSRS